MAKRDCGSARPRSSTVASLCEEAYPWSFQYVAIKREEPRAAGARGRKKKREKVGLIGHIILHTVLRPSTPKPRNERSSSTWLRPKHTLGIYGQILHRVLCLDEQKRKPRRGRQRCQSRFWLVLGLLERGSEESVAVQVQSGILGHAGQRWFADYAASTE